MERYHNLTEMLAVNHTAHAYFDSCRIISGR